MKLDNYILNTNKKIVICYFSVISFLSLVRTPDYFEKILTMRKTLGFFSLLMATGFKHASLNE